MPKYLVRWHETLWRDATIEAANKEEAWELVRRGDVMPRVDPIWEELESQVDSVEEITGGTPASNLEIKNGDGL